MKKTDVTEQVLREFQIKRQKAAEKAEAYLSLARQNEKFDKLLAEERLLNFEIGKLRYLGKDASEQQSRLEKNKQEQIALIEQMGFKQSDFEIKHDCEKCGDTGFVNGKKCVCLINRVNEELTKQSNVFDKNINFETFVPKNQCQKKVSALLEEIVKKGEQSKVKTVVLSGETGTGKSYMLCCAANGFLAQGKSVLYITAFSLNNEFLKIHLGDAYEKEQKIADINDNDVLVIDDLGSENILKNVTENYLYNLLNERMTSGKLTFVSTNCGLDDLRDRYGERIFSRLAGNSTLKINVGGNDLRLTKQTK